MKQKQQKILTHALKHVPFDGWTEATLLLASKEAGFDPNYGLIAFPHGARDLVNFYLQQLDDALAKALKKPDLQKKRIRDRIFTLVKTRLELAKDQKPIAKQTLSFYSLPTNAPYGMQSLWRTVDQMWHLAGDDSTDFNHYTKRTILSGVYSSTLLVYVNDTSKNNKNTWDFLERRIENVMQIGKCKSTLINAIPDRLKEIF